MIRVASASRTYLPMCTLPGRLASPGRIPRSAASWLSRFNKSSLAVESDDSDGSLDREIRRLEHLRNVGILAHVDAGKTTVTERMLALAGVVRSAGSVDTGNTVTDYLPAERERGITIQSAAISFEWGWHNNKRGDDQRANDTVDIQLIDTPGHVDFSVEVNRSVAVLDGAVIVVDAVAGVQAQTETVWRAITRPSWNNHSLSTSEKLLPHQDHQHEPLPCLALVNKMDKDGSNFGRAIESLAKKLPKANPVALQVPLFRTGNKNIAQPLVSDGRLQPSIVAVSPKDFNATNGEFVGVVDLVHMRAIVWPETNSACVSDVEKCIPDIVNLTHPKLGEPLDLDCKVTRIAQLARSDLIASLADVDSTIEELFLNDQEPDNASIREALRRATLARLVLPVMAGAALKGKGVEPVLDAVADLLPSPLDRLPPALLDLSGDDSKKMCTKKLDKEIVTLGHPLHAGALALAFKVVHMKGRGGSGDGRVVFARVYSGCLHDREQIQVMSPPTPGESNGKPRVERIGGMLELAGGKFDNLENGVCRSGEVCALVGLKTVVTGDTLLMGPRSSSSSSRKKGKFTSERVCLAGVASPKPVLTVRLEPETSDQQAKLTEIMALITTEDPSLVYEESDSGVLLSGLGELHIEVTLDRLRQDFGINVSAGAPAVAFRETILNRIETEGMVEYDRTIGGNRMQASVELVFEPNPCQQALKSGSSCMLLSDPVVSIGKSARHFFNANLELSDEDLIQKNDVIRALVQGVQGALMRGPLKSSRMANLTCRVINVDAEGGLSSLKAMPGALRAAAAHAVAFTLRDHEASCTVLEPTMSLEITVPNESIGDVMSDLTSRRGAIGDVSIGGDESTKSLLRGEVPLIEILGYANSLRSLTGGEGSFTAEYKGHSPC